MEHDRGVVLFHVARYVQQMGVIASFSYCLGSGKRLVQSMCTCHLQETITFFFGGRSFGLADILPQRFGPADLLTYPDTPLLLQPQHNPLELTAGSIACAQALSFAEKLTCRQGYRLRQV